MGAVLTGNPANTSSTLSATIASIANNGSGACRAATNAPHLFGNGDSIFVLGTGTAIDNALWSIAVIDATHFDLIGSTFVATATGTAIDRSLTPQVLVPSDGDPASAQLSGLVSSVQALLDRTQFLNRAAPTLVAAGNVAVPLTSWANVAAYSLPVTGGVLTPAFSIAGVLPGDLVELFCTISMSINVGSVSNGHVRLEASQNVISGSFVAGSSEQFLAPSGTGVYSMALCATFVLGSPLLGAPGTFSVGLNGHVSSTSGTPADFQVSEGNISYRVTRTN
jgi:hypothetical protein